ncbi:MAG: phage major capsid protein [Fibrobacter sp.]|nr:phage major capsid protein [Fibrobacter sp.]
MNEELKGLINQQRTMLDKAKAENRSFDADERKTWDSLQVKIDNLKKQIELDKNTDYINQPATAPIYSGSPSAPKNNNYRVIKNLFKGEQFSNDRFKSREEYFNALFSNRHDDRLRGVKNAASTGIGSQGGFAVPTEYSSVYWDKSLESEIIRSRAQVWKMTSDTRIVPMFNSQDTSTGIYGFVSQWLAELGTATVQTPELRGLKLSAHKLGLYTALSREVAEDGLDFPRQVENALTKALGWSLDDAFFNGNGVGKPIGILNAACKIVVGKENGQANNSIVRENLVKMFARLMPGSFQNAVWVVNQSCLVSLLMLKDDAGNPLWAYGKPLLGLPVIVSEKLPSVGNQGDIALCDFSCYAIGMRQEIAIDTSNAPGWTKDQIDLRGIIRVTGQPIFSQPIKQKDGNTVSPFVLLADRLAG